MFDVVFWILFTAVMTLIAVLVVILQLWQIIEFLRIAELRHIAEKSPVYAYRNDPSSKQE